MAFSSASFCHVCGTSVSRSQRIPLQIIVSDPADEVNYCCSASGRSIRTFGRAGVILTTIRNTSTA